MEQISAQFQERYRALMEAARGLITCTDLDSIVAHLLRHSLKMMQIQTCSMFIPDPNSQELIIYSARGELDRAIHTRRIPWDMGIAGHVFHEQKRLCIADVQTDPRFLRQMDQITGFSTRSMLCFPLLEKKKCLGVLQAINPLESPSFTELDQEIFEGLAGLITSALVRLENQKLREDEARFQREMSLAHEIQRSYLRPELPILARAEINVLYQSARTLGGDFYAVIPLSHQAVLFAVGDVSGKGIPAALTTAQVLGELNALASHTPKNLESLVTILNKHLCARLHGGRFIATTFLLYEPELDQIDVICAGQLPPWHWDGQTWRQLQLPSSLPLGVKGEYTYSATKIKTLPGERWLLSSDGINEGRNREKQEYGLERILTSLGTGRPQEVLTESWAAWLGFVDSHNLHDDACLGLMACVPSSSIRVLSGAKNCRVIRNFVEAWGMQAGLSDLDRGQVVLAMDEAFTNVLRHAYENEPNHPVDISASLGPQSLTFRVRDYGKTFTNTLPDSPSYLLKPGGMGIPILRKTFCSINYNPKSEGTELVLVRTLPTKAEV